MTEEHELKRIPYGVSDFRSFAEEKLYYMDKTRFIKHLEEKGKFLFLIRPRRFGKSLFLSMMEYYYDIAWKDRFDFLFQGTDIHQHSTKEKNSYIILKLNFSKVSSNNEKVEESFLMTIIEETVFFINKYEQFLDIDKNAVISRIYTMKSAAAVLNTLLTLCKGKEYRLYVIIDEYDNFANTILSEAGEREFEKITHGSGFFREFFNVLKAGTSDSGAPISKLFMTGVSPITLDDVTSGFNIASNISLDLDISEIMGFTKSEAETLIEYYRKAGKIRHSTPELLEIMSRWYNHYKFAIRSDSEVFNTVHVLYFLQEYMKEYRIPNQLIDRNARIDYNKLRHLIIIDKKGKPETNGNFSKLQQIMETGSITSNIQTGFPIEELVEDRNFISLLFYFGLLTITGETPTQQTIFSIPNEFVKRLFYDFIKETYEETLNFSLNMQTYSNLLEDFAVSGKWEPFIEYIAGRMEASLSLRDLMSSEKAHQVFWNVYLGLNLLYNVHVEKEMNQGFCDLVLEPLLANHPGIKYSYLIELKYIKPSDFEKEDGEEKLKAIRRAAENQLNQYSVDERLQKSMGQTTLKKLVLIFSGNRMVHHSEV